MSDIVKIEEIQPSSMAELKVLADDAAKSCFFGAKNQSQALMIMMAGRDLGLSYTQSLRAFHVVEGRPTLSADGMVAACVIRKDLCEYFRTIESTDTRCTVETKRRGEDARTLTFSAEDAKRAGLWGRNTWAKYPAAMLRARAKSALARDVYPDLLMGLYDPDELAVAGPAPATSVPVPSVATSAPKHGAVEGEIIEEAAPTATTPPAPPVAPKSAPQETAATTTATTPPAAPASGTSIDAAEASLRNAASVAHLHAATLAVKAMGLPPGPDRDRLAAAHRARKAELDAVLGGTGAAA